MRKITPFIESVRVYKRPTTPQPHPLSEVVIENQNIRTGLRWEEAKAQSIMQHLLDLLLEVKSAVTQAKALEVNPDLKRDIANIRLAESRLKKLKPSLDKLGIYCAGCIESAFNRVKDFENKILAESQPEEPKSDNLKLARVLLDIELRNSYRTNGSNINIIKNKKAIYDDLALFLNERDFASFAAIEKARPSLVKADFLQLRRDWAMQTYPEIKALLSDLEAEAFYVVSLIGAARGLANLAVYRLTEKISNEKVTYNFPVELQEQLLKHGSQGLIVGSREIELIQPVNNWHQPMI